MAKLLRALRNLAADLVYGVHAGHAIRHGLPVPRRRAGC